MDRLKDKIAVITQAGSYFGRAVAEAYAEEGAQLYLQDWEEREEVIEKLATRIRAENGVEVAVGVVGTDGVGEVHVAVGRGDVDRVPVQAVGPIDEGRSLARRRRGRRTACAGARGSARKQSHLITNFH